MIRSQPISSRADAVLRIGVIANVIPHLVLSVVALIANPDFTIGAGGRAVTLLGVDFNGWHAASGLLLFLPAFYAIKRTDLTLWYAVAATVSILGVTLVFAVDETVFGLFVLPNLRADVIYHVVGAAGLAAVLVAYTGLRRRESAAERSSIA